MPRGLRNRLSARSALTQGAGHEHVLGIWQGVTEHELACEAMRKPWGPPQTEGAFST